VVDWFENTLTHWGAILTAIVAIGTPIVAILGWFKPLLSWFRSRLKRKAEQKGITLSFVQNDRHCHWGEARLNDEPGTFISGRWDVTNSSNSDVMILKASLAKRTTRSAPVSTRHPEDERSIFGKFTIPSYGMSEVSVEFPIFPTFGRAPEPIISDVIFTDNFENEYRVPTKFYHIRAKPF